MSDSTPDPNDRTDDTGDEKRRPEADAGGERADPDRTDGRYADEGTESTNRTESGSPPDEPTRETGAGADRSDRVAFWVSVVIGLVLGVGAIAFVTGRAPFFEDLLRIRPTVEGGGIGADWIVGNTGPFLEAAIFLVHLADVVMGIFILLMVFIHWAAFRRLAARMRPPAGRARERGTAAATDGGVPDDAASADAADDSTNAANGGESR